MAAVESMEKSEDRYFYFDGLRGLAALNVAFHHFVIAFDFALYSGKTEHSHGGWDVTLSAYPFLFIGAGANFSVCIFLALSGFVLAKSFHNSKLTIPALLLKRSVRLGIPVLAASLLGWALLKSGLIFNKEIAEITRSEWLSRHFTQLDPSFIDGLRQAWNSLLGQATLQNSYNSVLWTMPIEFMGSILLMLVLGSTVSRQNRTLSGIFLLFLAALCGRTFVSIMLLGASAYLLQAQRLAYQLRGRLVILIVICTLGTIPFSVSRGPYWDGMVTMMQLVPTIKWHLPGFTNQSNVSLWHGMAAVSLIILISGWKQAQVILSRPFFKVLGEISFPLYLTHIPALFSSGCFGFMIAHEAGGSYIVAVGVAFLAYVPTTFVLVVLMKHWVDRGAIELSGAVSRSVDWKWLSRLRESS